MLRRIVLPALLCVLSLTVFASAQDQGGAGGAAPGAGNGGGGGGGRRGGGGGGGDPAQFRQRMMDNLKEQLGTTDDEWQVLQPKIEKVMTAQRDVRAGQFGGFRRGAGNGGPGGGGGGAAPQADTPVAKAMQDLRDTLQNKDATPETITQKLTALRDARTKAQTDLQASQKELKDVLTQRQEAVLVMMGMME